MTSRIEADWATPAGRMPTWFLDAKLGIFVHWGPYSVPAWAEPSGQLGDLADAAFFANNPYAEWYWNSLRIDGSPTALRHREVYGNRPYDGFLDDWRAQQFDPDALVRLFASAGAKYIVQVTKHHDGVTLWNAPGTGDRNTVRRGPRKDLVAAFADAARRRSLRFGTYYSGGLDWHVRRTHAIRSRADLLSLRPSDPEYAAYAFRHAEDLIRRYAPDLLWNDIEWPDAGKHNSDAGLGSLLRLYRTVVPDGVVNDRWGVLIHDFRTSEYQAHQENEDAPAWEHCRGIGYSFGYNQNEGLSHSMTAHDVVRLLVDVTSRGGNLLLNVGPRADGTLPLIQRAVLVGLAAWMRRGSAAIHGTRPVEDSGRHRSDDPWIRWSVGERNVFAVVDEVGPSVRLPSLPADADATRAFLGDIPFVPELDDSGGLVVPLPGDAGAIRPVVVRFGRQGRGRSEEAVPQCVGGDHGTA
jgi:alpha-L-fucosidase